jgi:hypothetical protein
MSEEEIDFEAESAAFEQQYEAGDRAALLHVIVAAWAHRQAVPEWAGAELARLSMRADDGNIASWDDVFGRPWGSGQQRGARTRGRALGAYLAVQDQIAEETRTTGKRPAIDNELLERAAKRSGVGGRSTVEKLYALVTRAVKAKS